MKKTAITFMVLLICFYMIACATPPVEEMNRAQNAVTRAENDPDAVAYAGGAIIRARDALEKMQSEADAKRYDEAKEYAAAATRNAEQAITDGKIGAELARNQALSLINSLGEPLAETADAISTAREVPNITVDFDTLSQDLDAAYSTYDDAWQNFQDENYQDAIDESQNVRSTISSINTILSEAAQDTSRKK